MSAPAKNDTPNPPGIRWDEGDVPVSLVYDDPYFAREDGLGETRHVFLAGNRLPDRFRTRTNFQVAELGFGTGLNFFATVDAWRNRPVPRQDDRLTFTSFERAPLTAAEMARAIAPWPDLAPAVAGFLERWPAAPTTDIVSLTVDDVTLELYLGDANQRLDHWRGLADAWFLDGFSPARNPELWAADLLNNVFAHTAPAGTFATYTVAGWVRRNLSAAGFHLEKFPGYGRKRESLRGWRP